MATSPDEELATLAMKEERKKFEEEGMQEAMAVDRSEWALWTPTTIYTCPSCRNENNKFMATLGTNKKEDQSEEPVITVRCGECDYYWQAEGENFGAGIHS